MRIGLGYVRSVGEEEAEAVAAEQPYADVADLARRAPVNRAALEALVASGACDRFGAAARAPLARGRRRAARRARAEATASSRCRSSRPRRSRTSRSRPTGSGCSPTTALTGLSIGPHPLELLRPHLPAATLSSRELARPSGGEVAVAGMAVARQRPATANGVVFMLLEDELGQMNLIVPPPVYEEHRALVRGEPLILARGTLERVGRNLNVVVRTLESLGPLAREIAGLAEVQAALPRAHHFGHR